MHQSQNGAHPRSRGEHRWVPPSSRSQAGSSPLARGTHRPSEKFHPRSGLIPARAGNTSANAAQTFLPWAHPRSRGEHVIPSAPYNRGKGSSPLARGTLAGCGFVAATAVAHPRSRGEHSLPVEVAAANGGSSPLARGTPFSKTNVILVVGLIPARAGNTPPPCLQAHEPRAHPRSRGEHAKWLGFGLRLAGSSPLARGTHIPGLRDVRVTGLIPARAGNTVIAPVSFTVCGAHPRSRGEHREPAAVGKDEPGSSPLARGTPNRRSVPSLATGLIPARAGNTACHIFALLLDWAHPRSRGEHHCGY